MAIQPTFIQILALWATYKHEAYLWPIVGFDLPPLPIDYLTIMIQRWTVFGLNSTTEWAL